MVRRAISVAAILALALPASAYAHVELSPDTASPGADVLFTVKSPNESQQPLTGVRLTVPSDLVIEGTADTPGFTSQVVRDQAGRVVSLSWQGGSVPPGGLVLFQFAGTVPDSTGEVRLTALQTFADGSTKLWHTPVVDVESPPSSSDSAARILGGAGVVLGVVALVFALRGQRRRAA
jgi:periplasmic copper chaperone A